MIHFIQKAERSAHAGSSHGEGKFVRHIKVVKLSDIDEGACAALLRQAAKARVP
jgi:hypothetical protein